MKTNINNNKENTAKRSFSISKWISNYITAMSKALYPEETKGVTSKNDRHRTFIK